MRYLLSLVVLLCIVVFSTSVLAEDKPNVLFILVDDLGWMDVGYQNPQVDTPNIDRLAREGTVFTDAYAATVCSPSRASILTGRTPATLKLTSHIPGVGFARYYRNRLNPKSRWMDAAIVDHLALDEVTFAEAFRDAGYATGFFGKWHLGGAGSQNTKDGIVNAAWHPQAQGFDINVGGCAYGQPDGPKPFFSPYKNGEITDGPAGEYLTERLARETVAFIRKSRNQPFLAFLNFYTIHSPLNPLPEMLAKAKNNRYLAMIYCLDAAVGRVLTALDELELRKNTIVVFTSDNGGTRSQKPLKGRKGNLYEGGIRVPLIYRWPGQFPAGAKINTPVSCEDFFPTLLEAADIDTPKTAKPIEGVSYLSLLTGKGHYQPRTLFQHFPHQRNRSFMGSAIRDGDWKLIWRFEDDRFELYNLAQDLGESTNLTASQPERTADMKKKLQAWLKKTDANMPRPQTR